MGIVTTKERDEILCGLTFDFGQIFVDSDNCLFKENLSEIKSYN